MKSYFDLDEVKYAARCWRHEILKAQAAHDVEKMLQAFLPQGFKVDMRDCDTEVPGFPHAPNYKVMATVRDSNPDGSDAHFFVQAYTHAGAAAKLLGVILDGRSFYPMT